MLNNLLVMSDLAEGTFVFILGNLVVFIGMALIILVVSVIGRIMEKQKQQKVQNEENDNEPIIEQVASVNAQNEEVPAHIKAAIAAVISAYYLNQKSECEFRIKKIKRI